MVDEVPRFDSTRVSIAAGQHICAMYFGVGERDDVLVPFLSDGLSCGDKCFPAIQEPDSANLISRLKATVATDVDVSESIAGEQLEIKTSSEHVLSPDEFDPSTIVEFWDTTV